MNRADRRKALKKGFDPAAIREAKELERRTADRATTFAVQSLAAAFVVVLHDKFGFGKQRLSSVINEVNDYFGQIESGEISLDELKETVIKEFGINLNKGGSQ